MSYYSEDDDLYLTPININAITQEDDKSSMSSSIMMYNNATDNATTTTSGDDDIADEDYYQADTLALVLPRITAIVSLLAVVCVALEAFSDISTAKQQNFITTRSNRVRSASKDSATITITRIQLFYQLPLFCHALAFALGTTPAPASLDVWGAVGNTATCEAQGFLLQFGIFGNVGWDVVLSTAYLLMVRYNVSSTRLLQMEKYYHLIIWPTVLALCIYPLVAEMYNINHSVCWLESLPNDCVGEECERGAGAPIMQTIASGIGVLHLLYSIAVMLSIYCAIRKMENNNRNSRYSFQSTTTTSQPQQQDNRRSYSRAVAIQGILYASGMILTTLPTAAYIIVYNITGLWSPGFGLVATSLTPLMGYVNFVVFMRGRPITDCKTTLGKFLRRIHSCLFDYKLVCQCNCRCVSIHDNGEGEDDIEAQQQQQQQIKKKNKKEVQKDDDDDAGSTAPTAPTTGTTTSKTTNTHKNNDGTTEEEPHPKQQSPSPQEDTNDDPNDADGARGRLTGTWIQKKSKASLISDLEGSESDYLDLSPMKPIRIQSQAEVEHPPLKPQRVVSELDDLNDDDDSGDDEDDDDKASDNHNDDDDSGGGARSHGLIGTWIQKNKSNKPTPLVSDCLEGGSESEYLDLSPMKPVRIRSEVEVEQPPLQPQRVVSELLGDLDEEDSDEDDEDETCLCNNTNNSGAPKDDNTHNAAVAAAATIGNNKSPPIRPMRLESEVSREEDDDDNNSILKVSYPPPTRVSPANTTNTTTKGNKKAPPAKPVRYASEVRAEEP